jgi:hypothetical protein
MNNPTATAHNLYAAIAAIFAGDAQDLLTAAKQATRACDMYDADWRDDVTDSVLDVIRREAEARLDCALDWPDPEETSEPILRDVLACIAEYYK